VAGLISAAFSADTTLIEGNVVFVDTIRFMCNVQTVTKQTLVDVRWLIPSGGSGEGGTHCAPMIGERVIVSTSLSYPLILGSLPSISDQRSYITATGGTWGTDLGTASTLRNRYVTNPTSPGGGIFSMLSSGAIVAKASSLAQIVLTKFGSLVRVVARNYQRFSDSSAEASMSIRGRLYHWFGQDKSFARNKTGLPRYNEVVGDVSLGEVYFADGLGVSDQETLPGVDDRVKKTWLKNEGGEVVMTSTLLEDGTIETLVGGKSKLKKDPTKIEISYNDISKVTIQEDKITAIIGETQLELTPTSGRLYSNSHQVLVTAAGIRFT
jgi:hypothetical protein